MSCNTFSITFYAIKNSHTLDHDICQNLESSSTANKTSTLGRTSTPLQITGTKSSGWNASMTPPLPELVYYEKKPNQEERVGRQWR